MCQTPPRFQDDERGFVVSAELAMISTVLVLSLVVGMNGLSQTVTDELSTMSQVPNATFPTDRYSTLNISVPQSAPAASGGASSLFPDASSG